MRVVVALGGNALLKRGEPMTAEAQRGNVKTAAPALAAVAGKHQLVLSHGNGPRWGCWRSRPPPTPRSRPIPWTCWARRPRA